MKKSVYIILAVAIAAGLTVVQSVIAGSIARRNEIIVSIASHNIKKGSILSDNDVEEVSIYIGDTERRIHSVDHVLISGKTATRDIPGGVSLTMAIYLLILRIMKACDLLRLR